MIIEEELPNRPDLIKRYSDEGFYIQNDQTGQLLTEAIDTQDSVYTYTETTEKFDEDFKRTYEMLNILMGK